MGQAGDRKILAVRTTNAIIDPPSSILDADSNGWRNLIITLGKNENEMARFPDMSLLDKLQREGFFERIGK